MIKDLIARLKYIPLESRKLIYVQLANYFEAGVSLKKTLLSLQKGYEKQRGFRRETKLLKTLLSRYEENSSFAELWDGLIPVEEQMLFSGEASRLPYMLKDAVFVVEKQQEVKRAVRSSFFEPFQVFVIFAITFYYLASYAEPALKSISGQQVLPAITQDFVQVLQTVSNTWMWLACPLVVYVVFALVYVRYGVGKSREILDHVFPFSLYKRVQANYFALVLSSLLSSGKDFANALKQIHRQAEPYLTEKVERALISTADGKSPVEAINSMNLFDVPSMLEIEAYSLSLNIAPALKTFTEQRIKHLAENVTKGAEIIGQIINFLSAAFSIFMVIAFAAIGTSAF